MWVFFMWGSNGKILLQQICNFFYFRGFFLFPRTTVFSVIFVLLASIRKLKGFYTNILAFQCKSKEILWGWTDTQRIWATVHITIVPIKKEYFSYTTIFMHCKKLWNFFLFLTYCYLFCMSICVLNVLHFDQKWKISIFT